MLKKLKELKQDLREIFTGDLLDPINLYEWKVITRDNCTDLLLFFVKMLNRGKDRYLAGSLYKMYLDYETRLRPTPYLDVLPFIQAFGEDEYLKLFYPESHERIKKYLKEYIYED